MIHILLNRLWVDSNCTIGTFHVSNQDDAIVFKCYSLEDAIRPYPDKVPGETCIWGDSIYPVVIDYSPKFKRDMPHVMNVPFFSGIRIHTGNTTTDTEGCIILGYERQANRVLRSFDAWSDFNRILTMYINQGQECLLIVSNPLEALSPA